MKFTQFLQKILYRLVGEMQEKRYQDITSEYNFHEYKRIYLVHIRKTGGTSLNNIFLSLSGGDPSSLYNQLSNTPDHRLIYNQKVYVGWNVRYINRGNYFYAFSHTPLYKLKLPEKTFTITCFRDPISRVLSHYNMLMDYSINKIKHPCMKIEGKWLGNSFDDFLKHIPKEHLCNQLYMFSDRYNVDEAIERVKTLSQFIFTERFNTGIDEINKKLKLNIKPLHIRKRSYSAKISENCIVNLREKLDNEYVFLNRIKDNYRTVE